MMGRRRPGWAARAVPTAAVRQRRQDRLQRLRPAAEQAGSAATQQPEPRETLDQQILAIALPTLATLAADPLAGLVSTSLLPS